MSPSLARAIVSKFRFQNPDIGTSGQEYVNLAKRHPDGSLSVPRGSLSDLSRLLRARGCSTTWKSLVHWSREPAGPLDVPGRPGFTLRPYQKEAVQAFLDKVQGVILLPCGAGKTVVGAEAMRASKQSALVLVPALALIPQWVSAVRLVNKGVSAVSIRTIGRGKKDFRPARPGEVVVASIQTLARNRDKAEGLLNSVGMLILDEAHRAPASETAPLVDGCPARYRLGLTASPERSDGWTFLLWNLFGPILYRKSPKELIDLGYLRPVTVIPFRLPFTLEREPPRHHVSKMTKDTYENAAFQQLSQQVCAIAARQGRTVLALSSTRDYAATLAHRLRGEGLSAAHMVSGMGKTIDTRLNQLRSGKLRIAVATSLAEEGLDVKRLDFLVQMKGGKSSRLTIQQSGRLMRPEGRYGVIVDMYPGGIIATRHAQARMVTYQREIGATITPVTSDPADVARLLERLDRGAGDPGNR